MRYETESLDTAGPLADGRKFSPRPRADPPDQPLQHPAPTRPDVPHDVSPDIKKAMLAAAYAEQMIDRLASLQNEEVLKYTGISRTELGLRVWNAPLAEVADRIGLKKHVLRRICALFEIPVPPKGYFNTSFAQRSIRWTRVDVGAPAR
ncbi:hypothetical protein CO669_25220 [Bradyrhizobium sp. Y36]|uniref:hypothetical protein n=1 Tax=Bradyrhizobium sp. Y36 TaxID=2035447 RepID=UPI000BE8A33B|nr:hypothetical protein [Bradyrhizobium sp. Y36]PDT87470.1 hypothetical protein CO669_25220 [Bradyrhizobium sp. Y36]